MSGPLGQPQLRVPSHSAHIQSSPRKPRAKLANVQSSQLQSSHQQGTPLRPKLRIGGSVVSAPAAQPTAAPPPMSSRAASSSRSLEPQSVPQTVEEINEHMMNYLPMPEVLATACRQLAAILTIDGCQDSVLEKIGVQRIIHLMVAHPASEDVQGSACKVLQELVADREDIQQDATKFGAVDAVMKAMRAHSSCEDLVLDGLSVLHQLSNAELGRRNLARLGGIGYLTHLLTDRSENLEILDAAVATLGNLAFESENRAEMGKDCVEAVLEAMRSHPTDSGLQESGSFVIHNLAFDPDILAHIRTLGCVEVLQQSLASCPPEHAEEDEREAALRLLGDMP